MYDLVHRRIKQPGKTLWRLSKTLWGGWKKPESRVRLLACLISIAGFAIWQCTKAIHERSVQIGMRTAAKQTTAPTSLVPAMTIHPFIAKTMALGVLQGQQPGINTLRPRRDHPRDRKTLRTVRTLYSRTQAVSETQAVWSENLSSTVIM